MTQAIRTNNFFWFDIYTATNANFADSTTYYSGNNVWATGSGITRCYPIRGGRIVNAVVTFWNGSVLGTTETSTLYLRLNNTTDYTLTSALTLDARTYYQRVTGLNIPLAIGDYVELKIVTPAWVTNPTAVTARVHFEVAY